MPYDTIYADSIAVLASAARTTSSTGSAVELPGQARKFSFQIVCSARSGTNPTLDAKIQHSIDGGTTWFDLVTFTQLTATGQELKSYAEVEASSAQVVGKLVRASWTVGGTNPSFTFAITGAAQG